MYILISSRVYNFIVETASCNNVIDRGLASFDYLCDVQYAGWAVNMEKRQSAQAGIAMAPPMGQAMGK
jgi:hypothetical protein